MNHVEVVRRYAAAPQQVWDVYTDHARMSEWAGLPGAALERPGEPHRNGRGAIRTFQGGVREEILDFEPPKRMTYRVIGGPFPFRNHFGEVDLEPDGTGTRLVWRCRFEPKIPGTGWLLQRLITRFFARALDGLGRRGFGG
jgi:uncharacterized protein YndB with AHSA1/START domain